MTFYAGFDAGDFPGQAILDWLKKQSNLTWCGYYLGPAPNHRSESWMGQLPSIQAQWQVLPIYVGQQDPSTGSNASSILTSGQGATDAKAACDLANAERFPAGTYIYLDWESGSVDAAGASEYITAWFAAVAASGTAMPGIYCSHTVADRIANWVSQMNPVPTVRYWCWKVDSADLHSFTGDLSALPTIDPTGCGASQAVAWQREQRAEVKVLDDGSSTIEMDFSTSSMANPASPASALQLASARFSALRSFFRRSPPRTGVVATPAAAPGPSDRAQGLPESGNRRHFGIWALMVFSIVLAGWLAAWRMSLDASDSTMAGVVWPTDCVPNLSFATNDHITVPNGSKLKAESNGVIAVQLAVADGKLKDGETVVFSELGSRGTAMSADLPLKKEAGDFGFSLTSDAPLISDAGVEVTAKSGLRLATIAGITYRIKPDPSLSGLVKVQGNMTQWVISAGTKLGTLVEEPVQLAIVQPASAPVRNLPKLEDALAVQFAQVTGSNGLRRIAAKADVLSPGATHSPQSVLVCAGDDVKSGSVAWRKALVTSMSGADSELLAIDLPDSKASGKTGLSKTVDVIAVTTDGSHFFWGHVPLVEQFRAALISIVLTALLLGTLMLGRGLRRKERKLEVRWISGLFTGPDNDPSLSLLQIFIWSVITVWGFLYVFVLMGSLLAMTTEMMQLLGIAGAGSVAARLIASSSGGSTSKGSPSSTAAPSGDFWQMLSTNGQFDMLKLQLFVFTVVIAPYVVYRIAESGAFPALDANTLLLLGVSQGVYVTSKLSAVTPLAKVQALKISLDTAQTALDNANATVADIQSRVQSAQVPAEQPAPAPVVDLQNQLQAAKVLQQTATAQVASLTTDYSTALSAIGLKQA